MIRIPSGPLKLLLIDAESVARNAQRSEGIVAPFVTVLVLNDDSEVVNVERANTIAVEGAVSLRYSQRGSLVAGSHARIHAAFATTDAVVLDADVVAAPAAPATTEAKPRKPARVTTIKTEENSNNG